MLNKRQVLDRIVGYSIPNSLEKGQKVFPRAECNQLLLN